MKLVPTALLVCAPVCALGLAPGAAAQQTVISEDSFDYTAGDMLGGKAGGTGWLLPWWSGNNNDDALIYTPGVDAVGEQLVTNNQDAGSYRMPDWANFPQLIDTENRFGIDDTTFWVSFWCQQAPGSTDEYGGFSFNEQLVAEKLFIGAPYQTNLWGMQQPGSPSITLPGTDPTVLTRFVIRVDHLAGDERVRVWLDPALPHPTGPADLDEMVGDFRWNEIRLQSGSNAGGTTGWLFDGLVIEAEGGSFNPIGTSYCTAAANSTGNTAVIQALGVDFAGGNPLQLRAYDLPPNQFGYFLTSQGQGFTPFPGGSQGFLCLSLPIGRFASQIVNSGANGEFDIMVDTNAIPLTPVVAIQPGETWNFQCWYRDLNPTSTSNFTDAVSVFFQ